MKPEQIDRFRSLPETERALERREVRVLVLTGLGLNCEDETTVAFRRAGATPHPVHILDLLSGEAETPRLSSFSIIAFIGGFAFGDHLGAGFVLANKIRFRLYEQLLEFIDQGGLALGICNGFQTMVRLGLLPGLDGDDHRVRATIAPNDRRGYWDSWVRLRFDPDSPCVWTHGLDEIELPTRHGEGKFLAESEELLDRMEASHQLVARYVDDQGRPTTEWPDNPNGSPRGVAGICDPTGRLFGLMPHPDAYLYDFQHPDWHQRRHYEEGGESTGLGMAIFQNGVDAVCARGTRA